VTVCELLSTIRSEFWMSGRWKSLSFLASSPGPHVSVEVVVPPTAWHHVMPSRALRRSCVVVPLAVVLMRRCRPSYAKSVAVPPLGVTESRLSS
jgi:hypothetical protein